MFKNKGEKKAPEEELKKKVAASLSLQHYRLKNTIQFLQNQRQPHTVSLHTPLLTPAVIFSQKSKEVGALIKGVREFNENQAHAKMGHCQYK